MSSDESSHQDLNDSENKERRRFLRVPIGIIISIRSEEEAEQFTANYSADLSLGGVFIKTFSPKPVGTKVTLEVPVPDPPGHALIHGEVTYHKRVATGDGVRAGMGVKFTRMDSRARHSLQQFINGNWRRLFKKPECIENESEAAAAILSIFDFLEAAFYFPLGSRILNGIRRY